MNALHRATAISHPTPRSSGTTERYGHSALVPAGETSTWELQGTSPAITHLTAQIQRVAPYFRTALLCGEPDCGEETAARLLHTLSPLADRPFLRLNPTDAELLLGTDFPPNAIHDAGLLYLTQPDRLTRSAQMSLLRLLRTRRPQPPPRLVVYSEHSLKPLVSTSGFSADLESALSALRITLPPLRERAHDFPLLLASALEAAATNTGKVLSSLSAELLKAAAMLPWHGNLAHLRAVAEQFLQRESTSPLRVDDLQAAIDALPQQGPNERRQVRLVRLEQIIQEHIRAVLVACNGNKLRAAEVLGISRSTLYRMLDAHEAMVSLPLAG